MRDQLRRAFIQKVVCSVPALSIVSVHARAQANGNGNAGGGNGSNGNGGNGNGGNGNEGSRNSGNSNAGNNKVQGKPAANTPAATAKARVEQKVAQQEFNETARDLQTALKQADKILAEYDALIALLKRNPRDKKLLLKLRTIEKRLQVADHQLALAQAKHDAATKKLRLVLAKQI